MILKNSAILNIYPNSSWISLKTYNKKDFNNNNCRNVFNISSVFLEDQSSIQIRSNDSYEKEISIFYFGTLNIRSKRILKFICLLFYSFIYLFVDFLIIYQFIHSLLFLFYSFNLFFFVTFWIISFVSCILFSKRYFHLLWIMMNKVFIVCCPSSVVYFLIFITVPRRISLLWVRDTKVWLLVRNWFLVRKNTPW